MDKKNRERLANMSEEEREYRRDRRRLVGGCHTSYPWVRMPLIEMDTKTFNALVRELKHTKLELEKFCGEDVAESLDIDNTIAMIHKVRDAQIVKRYNETS